MILSLSSLSSDDTKWWLGISEVLLIMSAITLAIGLVGEWSDSDSWKKRVWYKLAKAAVIIGVVGELLGDAGIFETTARLQVIEEGAIKDANTNASDAITRAADLDMKAAALNKEAADLRATLDKERVKTSPRPWKKEQFDAIQSVRGKVTDVGILVQKNCLECFMFASFLKFALHEAGVQLYGDDSLPTGQLSGIAVYLPQVEMEHFDTNPLIIALRAAELNPIAIRHNPPDFSQMRTDIPVIVVGEKSVSFFAMPFFPNTPPGTQWTELPLRKQQ